MEIKDFLPAYPNVTKSEYEDLNPYKKDFYKVIYEKKEFYDERLERIEDFPKEKGELMKHQKLVARFLSSHTPYNELLLVGEMGSGKTCTAIGAIEQIKSEKTSITGAYVFASGTNILKNWIRELREKCTAGQYIPEDFDEFSEIKQGIRTRKLYQDFYSFHVEDKWATFAMTAKYLSKISDEKIVQKFSNKILIVDEVHNLRDRKDSKSKVNVYKQFHRLFHLVKNSKILLLSGTPMTPCFTIFISYFYLNIYLQIFKMAHIITDKLISFYRPKSKGDLSEPEHLKCFRICQRFFGRKCKNLDEYKKEMDLCIKKCNIFEIHLYDKNDII